MHVAVVGAPNSGAEQLAIDIQNAVSDNGLHGCQVQFDATLGARAIRSVLLGSTDNDSQPTIAQEAFALTLLVAIDVSHSPPHSVAFASSSQGALLETALREKLALHDRPYSVVYGTPAVQLQNALHAIAHVFHGHQWAIKPNNAATWQWNFECCCNPECERKLFSALLGQNSVGG